MKHTQQAVRAIQSIPQEKMGAKLKRTATGLGIAGLGIALVKWLGAPWYVAAIGCGLGAHIWAGELVTASAKVLLGLVRDALAALPGGKTNV